MKLQNRMILSFGGFSLILLITLGLFILFIVQDNLTQRVHSELLNTSVSTAQVIQTASDMAIKNHLRTTAEQTRKILKYYNNQVEKKLITKSQAWEVCKSLIKDPDFGKIGKTGYLALVSEQGIIMVHPKSEGLDASSFDFMKQALKQKEGFLEYQWKNADDNHTRLKVGYLAYFEPWNVLVWASTYNEEFTDIIKSEDIRDRVLSIKIGTTGYPYVFDSQGNMIIHPKLEGQNVFNSKSDDGKFIFQEMIKAKNGNIQYNWKNPDESQPREKFAYFTYFPDLDWYIAISSYTQEYFGFLDNLRLILFIIVVLTIIINVIIVILTSARIIKPINKINLALTSLADKDLTFQFIPSGENEIKQMGMDYLKVTEALNISFSHVKQVTILSKDLSGELENHSMQVYATVDQMSKSMDTMQQGINQIHSEIETSKTNLQNVTSSIDQVGQLIESQAQAMNSSSSAITEMIAGLNNIEKVTQDKKILSDNLSQLAQQGDKSMQATVSSIQEISGYTQSILDLIKVINTLAAQTNLLAMNAAIEAAHAGDYGKGFSVVADEIRKLAETTAGSAKNISVSLKNIFEKIKIASGQTLQTNEIIKNIILGINDVSVSMNETLQGLQEVGIGSKQITESIEALNQLTEEIRSSSQSMNKGVQQTYLSTEQIYSFVDEYKNSMIHIVGGSKEIADSMDQLSKLSQNNTKNLTQLDDAIKEFKTKTEN